jgi:hypothetical protein
MDVWAEITDGINYVPKLCRNLNHYQLSEIEIAVSQDGSFLLFLDEENQIAVSWWVSPKRTRSYPYSRVYDTLCFTGKKVTIIPIMKDEGKDGERDFLQWDTISLMSLLGIYVIIGYYAKAEKSSKYANKITHQKFDFAYLQKELKNLQNYHSDALHWNLSQIEKVNEIARMAIASYEQISMDSKVEMHSLSVAKKRLNQLYKSKDEFMKYSRNLAEEAQKREALTVQPKENLSGTKATLTIKNFLGGCYFFTCDEVKIVDNSIYLVEGKHSKQGLIPSSEDIKDGLLKMMLFTNLNEVKVGGRQYSPVPILKLTSRKKVSRDALSQKQVEVLKKLKDEAETNNFKVQVNDLYICEIKLE